MLFLFRSAPEVKKRIHSKLFRKFWEEPGYKRANLHYCTKNLTICSVIQQCGAAKHGAIVPPFGND